MASQIALTHMRQGYFKGKGMLWFHLACTFLVFVFSETGVPVKLLESMWKKYITIYCTPKPFYECSRFSGMWIS